LDDTGRETRESGSELMIICPPVFEEAAHELADWKVRTGISTEVISTDETGASAYLIADYISDYCEDHDPAPQSILLFGDAEFIPPWYVHEFPGEGLMGTDIYYADLEMEFDYLLENHPFWVLPCVVLNVV